MTLCGIVYENNAKMGVILKEKCHRRVFFFHHEFVTMVRCTATTRMQSKYSIFYYIMHSDNNNSNNMAYEHGLTYVRKNLN